MAVTEQTRALRNVGLVILAVVAAATAAYSLVEGWPLLDSLYMVVITLTTVGFGEVRPLSPAGQALTMLVIVVGVSSLTYAVSTGSRMLIEGELRRVLGRRRMEREIANLQGHYIVCGYGRVGRVVCSELAEEGKPLVVVDRGDDSLFERLDRDGHLYIRGDATEESVLESANIAVARGLIVVLPSEADNVYVCLLAKELRADLYVLARSISDHGERRLRRAGADRVVSPNHIGGHRMAQAVLRPTVVQFMDIVAARHELELQLDEVRISEESELAGRSIRDCDIRRRYGLIVVGVLTPDGSMRFNPDPAARIEAGSVLIMLGRQPDLKEFAEAT